MLHMLADRLFELPELTDKCKVLLTDEFSCTAATFSYHHSFFSVSSHLLLVFFFLALLCISVFQPVFSFVCLSFHSITFLFLLQPPLTYSSVRLLFIRLLSLLHVLLFLLRFLMPTFRLLLFGFKLLLRISSSDLFFCF